MRKKQMAIVLAMILSAQAAVPAAAEDVLLPETEAVGDIALAEAEAIDDIALPETEAVGDIALPEAEAIDDIVLPETEAVSEIALAEAEAIDDIMLPETEEVDDIALAEAETPAAAGETAAADEFRPEMAAEEELIIESQEEPGGSDSEIPEELAGLLAEPAASEGTMAEDAAYAEDADPASAISPSPAADTAQTDIALTAENFPDEAFCTYLGKFDTDKDGSLSAEELAAVTEIDVVGKGIADLTGVENFTAITALYCDNNQLTGLDVSKNTKLKYLQCAGNQITALNLQKNTALISLVCSGNQIGTLDISKNTRLQDLRCVGNRLTVLDISHNKSLAMVDCSQNEIADLNVSGRTNLHYLWCSQNCLTSLDVSGDTKLQWLDCSQNQIASLNLKDAINVSATGDSAFNILNCADNRLTSLDVSGKQYMKGLICDNNQLTELELSTNVDLRELRCSSNALTSLHVMNAASDGKVKLQQLDCSGNRLTSLDLRYLYITESNILPNCSGQNFAMELTKTENGCQVDLNPYIGDAKLVRLAKEEFEAASCTEKSTFGNVILLTQEGELKDGILTFTEQIPETIELVCATGYQKKAKETDVLLEIRLQHTHSYESKREEPTCTQEGAVYEVCTVCGAEKEGSRTAIPTIAHSYEVKRVTEPTCAQEGESYEVCTVCGAEKEGSRAAIPTSDHDYEKKITEPTCTQDGVIYEVCTVCGTEKEGSRISILATGHNYLKTQSAPTCTKEGSVQEVCAVCGETKKTPIPALGHSYGEYQMTQAPTIFAEGKETRRCSVCGDEQSRALPKLPGTVTLAEKSLPVQVKENVNVKSLVTGLQENDSVVSWKSGDESVLTITDSGKIVAKKTGQTDITVITKSGAAATMTVKVQKEKVSTEKITGLSNSMKLTVGKSITLHPVLSPLSSQDKVTYTSSNKKIVTVSGKGVVKGIKAGTAKITVKSGSKKFQIKIQVSSPAVEAIKKVPAKKTLKVGKSFTIKPKLSPTGSSGKIKYTSSNKKVATVSAKGKVKAKKKGTAVITVSVGKIMVKCKVTVK